MSHAKHITDNILQSIPLLVERISCIPSMSVDALDICTLSSLSFVDDCSVSVLIATIEAIDGWSSELFSCIATTVGDELYGSKGIKALVAAAYDTPLSTGDGVYITDGEVDDIGVVGCHIALPLFAPIDIGGILTSISSFLQLVSIELLSPPPPTRRCSGSRGCNVMMSIHSASILGSVHYPQL